MNKAYERINWVNSPSMNTPLGASNLNKTDYAINEIDNRVISIDTSKADLSELSDLFKDVSYNKDNGIITFTRYNGGTIIIDTALEKLAVNFDYDASAETLVITLSDGTQKTIDMSALITQYEFLDSDTIAFTLSGGKVSAIVKEGSIEEKHLRPDYLADITVQAQTAAQAMSSAAASASNAKASEGSAKEYTADAQWAAGLVIPNFYIDYDTGWSRASLGLCIKDVWHIYHVSTYDEEKRIKERRQAAASALRELT